MRELSIGRIIFLSLLVIGGSMAIIGAITSAMLSTRLIEAGKTRSSVIASSLAVECDDYVRDALEDLVAVSRFSQEGLLRPGMGGTFLETYIRVNSEFESVMELDERGILLNLAPPQSEYQGLDFSGQEYFREAVRRGKPYISNTFISLISQRPAVTAAVPAPGRVLVAEISITALERKLAMFNRGTGRWLELYDSDGTCIAHPDRSFVLERRNSKNRLYVSSALAGRSGNYEITEDGKSYIVSAVPSAVTGWVVVVKQSEADILAPTYGARAAATAGFVIIIALSVVYFYFLYARLLSPLLHIVGRMSYVADGNYLERVEEGSFREVNSFIRKFNAMIEAIGRRERRIALSERRLDRIFTALHEALLFVDSNGVVIRANPAAALLYGAVVGERILPELMALECFDEAGTAIPPDDMNLVVALRTATDQNDRVIRIVRGDMPPVWVRESACVFRGENGILEGVLLSAMDITRLKEYGDVLVESVKQKEVLLKEIHHRVKNNLQIISSLLSLQANTVHDPVLNEVIGESRNRIRTMAILHERLYQSSDFSRIDVPSYLANLAGFIISTGRLAGKRNAYIVEADNGVMSIDEAVPFGLVVNELISNSIKHGFDDQEDFQVRIAYRHGERGERTIMVADNGRGLPDSFDIEKLDTLGIKLVRSLSVQLAGALTVQALTPGCSFSIRF